jgi:hypothetical protein
MLYYQNFKGQHRVFIPKYLIFTVLTFYHELPFTAHQGERRTLEFIRKKYWWETMRQGITNFIKVCTHCVQSKTGHMARAPLGEAPMATEFLDVVSLDVVGPLPVTERGNKYLLSFVDHFTRYCDPIPIPKQDTETTARAFVLRIITQIGVPRKN